jgi:hypothetical protein
MAAHAEAGKKGPGLSQKDFERNSDKLRKDNGNISYDFVCFFNICHLLTAWQMLRFFTLTRPLKTEIFFNNSFSMFYGLLITEIIWFWLHRRVLTEFDLKLVECNADIKALRAAQKEYNDQLKTLREEREKLQQRTVDNVAFAKNFDKLIGPFEKQYSDLKVQK